MNPRLSALPAWVGLSLASMVVALACTAAEPDIALSPIADEGRELARSSGCAACHGRNGQGGVGPSWKGLAGSTVTFVDFSSGVADTEYLTTSVLQPSAQLRQGYSLKMPENNLTEEEVEKVVAYIEELR